MFNLINENLLEKTEDAQKAEAALNDINKICAKYADKKKLLKYAGASDQEERLTVLSAYLLFLTARTEKNVSFQDLIEKKVFVDLDFRRKCKINNYKFYNDIKNNNPLYVEQLRQYENEDDDFSEFFKIHQKERSEDNKKNNISFYTEYFSLLMKYEDKFDPHISADYCFKKGVGLSNAVYDMMTEELWDHLKKLLKKYSAEIFKEVALCATNAETLNANETIAAIVKILEIKDDDAFLFDGAIDSADFISFYQLNKKVCYTLNNPKTDILVRGALLPENVKVWGRTPDIAFDKIFFLRYDADCNKNYRGGYLLSNNGDNDTKDEDAADIVQKTAEKFSIDHQALFGETTQVLFDYCNLLENIESLKKAKKAVCQFPNEALYAKRYEPFRRILIENGLVESVLGGKEKSFLVLSNGNTKVSFYKAYDNFFRFSFNKDDKKLTAANADILGNGANLYFEVYLNDDDYLKNAVSLKNVTKKSFRGVSCTAEEIKKIASNNVRNKRFLKYSDITDGIISNDMQSLLQIDEKYKEYCAKEGDLIISKICSPFKVSVIEGTREILVGDNLYVIRLDEKKADPYCVKAFLESSKGKRQIEKILSEKKSRALSLQDVLNLKIELIDRNAQYVFADEYKKRLHDIIYKQGILSKNLEELSHMWEG